MPNDRTCELTVVAQDPSFRYPAGHPKAGRIATARIRVPAETLSDGPRGYRVHCIDFDASTDTYYNTKPAADDRFIDPADDVILGDPSFHCQNAYALVMHTLARFEFALGRRVSWGFYGHQIKVAPHAFAEANAFYSEEDHALLFGYFFPETDDAKAVFTCLSHDVIVHETTHALLDGLRTRYTDPSSADQAAFHEGFSDVVALLSIFSLREVPELIIQRPELEMADQELISVDLLTPEALRAAIGGLAEEVGQSLDPVRGQPLRESMSLRPETTKLSDPEFEEPHRRGEVFVAAMMNAFLELWGTEIARLGEKRNRRVDRMKVIEEGARIADVLLTSAIRALDYTPPVDLTFEDYVSAFLTADEEIRIDDTLGLRHAVRKSFADYGIPAAESATERGTWKPPGPNAMRYDMTHFEPMQRDPDEVFHFVWENRGQGLLELVEDGYTRILSVRPCVRIGSDGFTLRETVCEYLQVLKVRAGDLSALKRKKPDAMPDEQELYLYGGGSLIFDEYGRLKYHIYNPLLGSKQDARIEYLWNHGEYSPKASRLHFAGLHRMRGMDGFAFGQKADAKEVW